MTIDRRQIFTLAWKRAKATAAGYRTLRTAFTAALRSVWALVKAMVAEDARRPVRPVQPVSTWASENAYRAAAVANRKARLGSYCTNQWQGRFRHDRHDAGTYQGQLPGGADGCG